MKPRDLADGTQFDEPEPPQENGPDAQLFAAYAAMRRHDWRLRLSPAEEKERRAELRKVERAYDRARARFMTAEARTLEGVVLKLRAMLAGQVLHKGSAGVDDTGFLVCAIEDLERLSAELEGGAPRRRRRAA